VIDILGVFLGAMDIDRYLQILAYTTHSSGRLIAAADFGR